MRPKEVEVVWLESTNWILQRYERVRGRSLEMPSGASLKDEHKMILFYSNIPRITRKLLQKLHHIESVSIYCKSAFDFLLTYI
jgi:hypothetical protein